jgi:hypothetical protein
MSVTAGTEKSKSLLALVSEVCRAWIMKVANCQADDAGMLVGGMVVPESVANVGDNQPR